MNEDSPCPRTFSGHMCKLPRWWHWWEQFSTEDDPVSRSSDTPVRWVPGKCVNQSPVEGAQSLAYLYLIPSFPYPNDSLHYSAAWNHCQNKLLALKFMYQGLSGKTQTKTTGTPCGLRNQIFRMGLWDLSKNVNKVGIANGRLPGVNL